MHHDVIVIGGSYAGMAAILQLVRARRSVLVIDAGVRRSRFTTHSHGFLGQDGADPGEIAANARRQLQAYPTLAWREGRAETISGQLDDFSVTTADGKLHRGRRVLLATGVTDELPAVDGLAERWGKSVFHCPYCHGYELEEGTIGVIGAGPASIHQAELLTDWGQVTLLVNQAVDLTRDARTSLQHRHVTIEESSIVRIEGNADVAMADGRVLWFSGLFTGTRTVPSDSLAAAIGCALEETPTGVHVRTNGENKTSVAGIFACGDVSLALHSVSLAVGHGAVAGSEVHRSLVWPDTVHLLRDEAGTT